MDASIPGMHASGRHEAPGAGGRLPHVSEDTLVACLGSGRLLSGRAWQALAIAKLAHWQQRRFDGASYLEQHVYPVAEEVALAVEGPQSAREDTVVIALLHDVLEDCPHLSGQDLAALFGPVLAEAVDCLTKPWTRQPPDNPVSEREREDREAAYFARIQRAPRHVQLVKVADRLNNLACVHQKPARQREQYLAETERFHLPLARHVSPALAQRMAALCEGLRRPTV